MLVRVDLHEQATNNTGVLVLAVSLSHQYYPNNNKMRRALSESLDAVVNDFGWEGASYPSHIGEPFTPKRSMLHITACNFSGRAGLFLLRENPTGVNGGGGPVGQNDIVLRYYSAS